MKRPFVQWLRSAAQSAGLCICEWAFDHFSTSPATPLSWRDHARWFVEDIGERLFALGYANSDEELRDAEDIPEEYRSERQRRYLAGGAA